MNSKEIKKTYGYAKRSAWEHEKMEDILSFSREYQSFVSACKTERECIRFFVDQAKERGFSLYRQEALHPGDRFYFVNKDKGLLLGIMGKEPLENGFRLVGAHVDAPRLDLKAQPLYEEEGMALLKTHYYGGIKKYHWTSIPLAIHGIIVPLEGDVIEFVWGEKADEPVYTITDLLPHLAKDQMKKPMGEAIEAESLNVLFGGIPIDDPEGEGLIKAGMLHLLHEKIGMREEDFISAEIEVVPAGAARDVGLDGAYIGAYGQDDRVCAYGAVRSLWDLNQPRITALVLLTDKEEIGSAGNTGAQSLFLEQAVGELAQGAGLSGLGVVGRILQQSKAVSADVSAAQDPNYPNLFDVKNAPSLGKGVVLTKYTGARGKYDANDASAEMMGELRRMFHQNGVIWQTGELGKVDQGGGGTIAMFLSRLGMETVDCGPALLGMHSPFEVASKADIHSMYQAYRAFLKEV